MGYPRWRGAFYPKGLQTSDVLAYFNNDVRGYAPRDAARPREPVGV